MIVVVVVIVIVVVVMIVVPAIAVMVVVAVPLLDHGGPTRGFVDDAAADRQQDGRDDQAKERTLHDQGYRPRVGWKWRLTVEGSHLGET